MLLLYKNSNIYEMAKRYLYLRKISGWLLRNILFALVVLKADCSRWSHPCALVVPKALKNINEVDVFGFLSLVCLRKRAFDTASKQKTRTVRAGFVTPSGFKPETF